jgi:predicted metal-dependent peptidase
MQKKILEFITPTVDWKAVLRYFIKTSQRCDRPSTVRRLNRRYPWVHPGKKIRRQAKIAISIDQSGSVSDKLLSAFFGELNNLSSLAEFTVVPFDTSVCEEKVFVWKRGESKAPERVLHGGTCFNAPTKWVNEHDFDGHIVLTDLEAPKPINSNCQRMWMTAKRYADNPYFKTNERVIPIILKGSVH